MLAFGLYMGFVRDSASVIVFTLLGSSVALFAVALSLLLKLRAYRILDPAKVESQPEAKAEPKPEAKVKTPSDLTPQIATRAYELYEKRGRNDGLAVQDWEKAEREIRKEVFDPAKAAEPQPEAEGEAKPEAVAGANHRE